MIKPKRWGCMAVAALLFFSGCSAGKRNESYITQISGDGAFSKPMASADYADDADYASYDEAGYEAEYAYNTKEMYTNEAPAYGGETVDTGANPTGQAQKIIQTGDIRVQTDQFDTAADNIRNTVQESGGYVEQANQYNMGQGERNARMLEITLRVPSERFEDTLRYIGTQGHVTNESQQAENVTTQYYDIASRLETKLVEEARLLEMIDRAEYVEDLLALEQRLGEVRTVIEQYQMQMTSIDRLSAYATIYLRLTEVTPETLQIVSEGLGGRIRQAFVASLNGTVVFFQNIVIFLAGALIPLAIVGILLLAGLKTVSTVGRTAKKEKGMDENEN